MKVEGGTIMSLSEEAMDGTLRPDGTLALDQQPSLPAGRVRVIIQAGPPAPARGLADVIDEIWAGQQARGFSGRSAAEMQAELQACAAEEDTYERRMQTIWSQTTSAGPQSTP
jgi:hypothetical protein